MTKMVKRKKAKDKHKGKKKNYSLMKEMPKAGFRVIVSF
jgi:hypothetical protein